MSHAIPIQLLGAIAVTLLVAAAFRGWRRVVAVVVGATMTFLGTLMLPLREYGAVDWDQAHPLAIGWLVLTVIAANVALVGFWLIRGVNSRRERAEDVVWLWLGITWAAFVPWALQLLSLD